VQRVIAARRAALIECSLARTVTFHAFAEDWRRSRTHDVKTAGRIERQLRLHVYPVIGDRTMRELGKRPSIVQAWISGLRLAPSSARQVIKDVTSVFVAAADDGLVTRNPLRAQSVSRPNVPERKARPWTLAQVQARPRCPPGMRSCRPPRRRNRDAAGRDVRPDRRWPGGSATPR
jgi:hypothetical protein